MRWPAVFVVVFLAVALLRADGTGDLRLDEYRVKAAFLYKFAKFVEWPSSADVDAPFVIGVAGDSRVVEIIEGVVRGKTVRGRSIHVRHVRSNEDPNACNMLFVTVYADRQSADLVREARARAVLTIGEGALFLRDGGLIRFIANGNRVRFQINAAGAEQAGFRISSQLLSLSVVEP